ncbi:uncharacterized protein EAF01_008916 [Botrytis porri]|uniref:uncharacterized protein n=1 Tax=Botrytis porri TaxID=87229 RepID=UPI001900B0B1|nr:uncharacterized protein EAF01_008916 [Botrytis porri]KAF7897950.1 hypothetical protein EAF01_008916 [Botrytis porri]
MIFTRLGKFISVKWLKGLTSTTVTTSSFTCTTSIRVVADTRKKAIASGSGTHYYAQNQRPVHDTGHADSGYYQPTTQASGSRYPDNPTSYDQGSTSGYGADYCGQSNYQPSGSGNNPYKRDQPSVYDTSGTSGYQASGYDQYPSQSGRSVDPGYAAGGQQYDHENERTDESYGGVNTSEQNIITAEPQNQERTPAPRDSTASGSRPSRKGKERSRR